MDFAQLFREQLGVDPDKHLDLTNIAWEKLQVCTPPFKQFWGGIFPLLLQLSLCTTANSLSECT